ncbi:DUF2867 domain-containing protein [Photobacterium sp. TY1-4]|uniref:DUF2867 domain-containing protein n=1 Tax=Photobacterium sp. TY1-4 TaxID=2899122 RepID=UPI0021C1F7C8|nr:DUF2867 domain-containing protein [Photobacterium sp. TY1-4]UXI02975.1 DUF2867 domain-containing protein [Photobacterium sp. TY1-4]
MIKTVAVPMSPLLEHTLPKAQFADAYEVELNDPDQDVWDITYKLFTEGQQDWIKALMGLRNLLVTPFGLKTGPMNDGEQVLQERIGIFKVYEKTAHEVLLGENDRHLDFRISVLKDTASATLTVTTKVEMHNTLGRAYITVIEPFHRMIVKSMLRQAKKKGAF